MSDRIEGTGDAGLSKARLARLPSHLRSRLGEPGAKGDSSNGKGRRYRDDGSGGNTSTSTSSGGGSSRGRGGSDGRTRLHEGGSGGSRRRGARGQFRDTLGDDDEDDTTTAALLASAERQRQQRRRQDKTGRRGTSSSSRSSRTTTATAAGESGSSRSKRDSRDRRAEASRDDRSHRRERAPAASSTSGSGSTSGSDTKPAPSKSKDSSSDDAAARLVAMLVKRSSAKPSPTPTPGVLSGKQSTKQSARQSAKQSARQSARQSATSSPTPAATDKLAAKLTERGATTPPAADDRAHARKQATPEHAARHAREATPEGVPGDTTAPATTTTTTATTAAAATAVTTPPTEVLSAAMDVSADSARASTPTDTNATPPGTPPSGPQTTAGDAERGGGAKRRVPPGGAVEEGDGTPDMKRAATTADDEDDTPTRRERQYMDEKVEKEVERKEGRQRGKELDGGGRSGDGGAAVTREQHSDATVTTAAAAVSEEVMVHDPLDAFDSDMHEEAPEIYFPAEKGCRSIDVYERLNMIDEGTYGVVFRVKDTSTGEVLAVKRLKMEAEREGFPITSLREINTLLKAKHENVVNVKEIVTGHTMNDIFICMEFVEHDLKSLLETMKQPLLHAEVKMLMQQLLQGVHHLHDNWIIHRDLKTSNLLLSHRGVLKIADFGLAREFGSPLKVMTQMVVTLWYRAPELLLGAKKYTAAIDLWSVGCIFAELITTKALFPGKGEIDTIKKIFTLLGTPSEEIWDGYNDLPAVQKVHFAKKHGTGLINEFGNILNRSGLDLLSKLLTYDPARRISAADSVEHAWFRDYPPPTEPELFPHYPARAEGHQRRRHDSPSAPVGGHMNEEERELYMLMKESRPSGFNLKFG